MRKTETERKTERKKDRKDTPQQEQQTETNNRKNGDKKDRRTEQKIKSNSHTTTLIHNDNTKYNRKNRHTTEINREQMEERTSTRTT